MSATATKIDYLTVDPTTLSPAQKAVRTTVLKAIGKLPEPAPKLNPADAARQAWLTRKANAAAVAALDLAYCESPALTREEMFPSIVA